MPLTNAQIYTLARASVLLPHCAAILSDFEVETLADVSRRFLRFGREAVTTAEEWEVVAFAVDAMSSELHSRRADPRPPVTSELVAGATARQVVRRMGVAG